MPDGGITEAGIYEAIAAVAEWWAAYGTYVEIALVVAASYQAYESGVRAKNAYNASLRDRYVMQRTSSGQRSLVLGRARASGPVAFMQSYGNNQTTLAIVVVLAAHECDAIEKIYFNDQPVILDTNGNVTGILSTEHFSVNNSSSLTVFLAQPARFDTVAATAQYPDAIVSLGTSLSSDGLHLTLTGARSVGVGDVTVTYQPGNCQYTPNQIADQTMTVTATATSGSTTFPAYSGIFVDSFVHGILIGSAHYDSRVSTPSIVVVQAVGGVQTVLPFTLTTDSSGFATAVNWSGATVGAQVLITYQAARNFSRARIRQYLGAPGQTADAKLIASLPGEWTTNHVGNGLCYLVCEFDYDQSSFSAGLPNVSAVLRGAKVFDPRTGSTAWSENPAIVARGYWTHPLGAAQPAANVDDAAIIAAANVCDVVAPFMVGPLPRPAPLYTAGYVATRDQKPQDVLTDLCMAMGGRWVINANLLRVKAGSYTAPVAAIDASWLTSESSVVVQPLPARQTLFNTAQGTFCDERNDYRAVPYAKVAAAPLIASDGRELDLDLTYAAVTKSAQAQYLSACAIRYNRAGMTVKISCNMRAFPLEVFDVVTLTLTRFGFVAQTFEVTDTAFTPEGLIVLTMKYISPAIYAVDSSYNETAYAPKTLFPEPWVVSVPVLGTPLTGPSQLLLQTDGTVVSRIFVPITIVDPSVLTGGYIDVAYIDVFNTTGNWDTATVSGDSLGAYLSPLKDGHVYLIKARARNTLYASAWSTTVSCAAVGQTNAPGAVSGLSYFNAGGNIFFSWTPCTDADYKQTVIQYSPVGVSGVAWDDPSMTHPFAGPASGFMLTSPGAGAYEFQFRHYNRSGIATGSSTITVIAPDRMEHIISSAATTATWTSVSGRPVNYRVASRGNSATSQPIAAGFYDVDSGTSLYGASRSYNMVKISRSTGSVLSATSYDVFGGGTAAATLASDLNACTSAHIVVVYGYDEPLGNRLTGGLDTAMYRCGASRGVFGSPNFQFRSAYILIGVGNCGEGQGFEAYHGAAGSDPDAWCDVAFQVLNGNVIVSGTGATPRTLSDYSYTGDLAATRNLVSYQSATPTGAFNGDLWFNTASQTWETYTSGAWQVVSDVTASKIAAGITGQGALATLNTAGTTQITVGAATDVYADSWAGVTASLPSGSNTYRSFTVTPVTSGTIEFTASMGCLGANGDNGIFMNWQVTPSGGSTTSLGGSSSNSSTLTQSCSTSASFTATGGVALLFEIVLSNSSGGHPSVTLSNSRMRVTVVKR